VGEEEAEHGEAGILDRINKIYRMGGQVDLDMRNMKGRRKGSNGIYGIFQINGIFSNLHPSS
jgi:hypothetical protein